MGEGEGEEIGSSQGTGELLYRCIQELFVSSRSILERTLYLLVLMLFYLFIIVYYLILCIL